MLNNSIRTGRFPDRPGSSQPPAAIGSWDQVSSKIDASNPFSAGAVRKASMAPQAYRGGQDSRSAFARALTDQSAGDMRNQFDTAQQEYRQKAETVRARDIQSQREFQAEGYGLGREREVGIKQQDANRRQKMADLDAYMQRAKADYRVNRLQNLTNLLLQGGLFAAPTVSNLFRAGQLASGSGASMGLTGPAQTQKLSGYAPAIQDMPWGGLPLSEFPTNPVSRLR
jgi:hypothetical protein